MHPPEDSRVLHALQHSRRAACATHLESVRHLLPQTRASVGCNLRLLPNRRHHHCVCDLVSIRAAAAILGVRVDQILQQNSGTSATHPHVGKASILGGGASGAHAQCARLRCTRMMHTAPSYTHDAHGLVTHACCAWLERTRVMCTAPAHMHDVHAHREQHGLQVAGRGASRRLLYIRTSQTQFLAHAAPSPPPPASAHTPHRHADAHVEHHACVCLALVLGAQHVAALTELQAHAEPQVLA
eukprot:364199-Chlamydomonas_euryale.AAC.1